MPKTPKIFVLYHTFEDEDCVEHLKYIAVYQTREAAEEAIMRLSSKPGFVDHREGFVINETEFGREQWEEGFISWDEAIAAARES